MTNNGLFIDSCNKIEREYRRLNHTLGYRFLLGSQKNLVPETEILFLGLNPGGSKIPPDHPDRSCENGPAFLVETWGAGSGPGNAPLQNQVQKMFLDLAEILPGSRGTRQLMNDSLLSYYIPFRSPNVSALPRRSESRIFAKLLWSDILQELRLKLIITMDKDSFTDIVSILGQNGHTAYPKIHKTEVGWGNISAELAIFGSGIKRISVLRFPHLSRFKIFGRPESKPYTDRLISKAVSV